MTNHAVTQRAINWVEQGLVPDLVIRKGIARLCRQRLADLGTADCEAAAERFSDFVALMDASKLAELTDKANEQHYEVPAAFYAEVLGRHRKYSSCFWGAGIDNLDDAEAAALKATCERAGLTDGMDVLELGCGWGSLTLWMAERYPNSRITAVSNSHSQRARKCVPGVTPVPELAGVSKIVADWRANVASTAGKTAMAANPELASSRT